LSALGQVKTGMQLGHGRPDQPGTDSRSSAVESGGSEFGGGGRTDGSSMRFAYPISPSAALTDMLVMLVFLFL
jgi:hypothetical protein